MAQANFHEFVQQSGAQTSLDYGRWLNTFGAVTSLALILGVGFWGYKLAVRDVNGVPVIQAMQGPMRIAPEDPGGQVANHMGLAVNRVAAEGTVGATPDQITLSSGAVALASDDAPGIGAAAHQVPPPRPASLGQEAGIVASLAMTPEMTTGVLAPEALPETLTGVSQDAPAGMATSLRPRARPARGSSAVQLASADINTTVAAAAAAAALAVALQEDTGAAPATPTAIDNSTLTEGTRLAQIGAFDDEASAIREWDRISSLHSASFAGKARVIQPATSAGRTFYRLRVHGFDSEEASRSFCAGIEAPDLRCIPVIHR